MELTDPLACSFNPLEKKRSKGNNPHNEAQKLLHKMKRERKGARKDIRADAAFLAVQKHKEMRDKWVHIAFHPRGYLISGRIYFQRLSATEEDQGDPGVFGKSRGRLPKVSEKEAKVIVVFLQTLINFSYESRYSSFTTVPLLQQFSGLGL
jgi:hypothetical protein